MREILFKGRTKSGDWVEGFLSKYQSFPDWWNNKEPDKYMITSFLHDDGEDGLSANEIYAVDPLTIGQFTGLCDKNGKKIFEGDIVEINNGQYRGEVRYGDGTSMFYIYQGESRSRPLLAGWSSDNSVEVIGNVYEGEGCD